MKLTREQIAALSREMVSEIGKRGLVRLLVPLDEAVAVVERRITEDLQVEDRLNEEVKEILKTYSKEIDQGRADYNTMFDLVKKKLVKERGIIL